MTLDVIVRELSRPSSEPCPFGGSWFLLVIPANSDQGRQLGAVNIPKANATDFSYRVVTRMVRVSSDVVILVHAVLERSRVMRPKVDLSSELLSC